MRIKGKLTKRWNTHGIMYAIPENNEAEIETNWGEDEIREIFFNIDTSKQETDLAFKKLLKLFKGNGVCEEVKCNKNCENRHEWCKTFKGCNNYKPKEIEEVKDCSTCLFYYEPKNDCHNPEINKHRRCDNYDLWQPKEEKSANNAQKGIDWEGLKLVEGDPYSRSKYNQLIDIVKELKENK